MKRKPYPITGLTKGLDVSVDGVFLIDQASPDLSNVRFDRGIVKKDFCPAEFGKFDECALVGTPMEVLRFETTNGNSYQVCITTSNFYVYNATTGIWDCYTPGETIEDCEDDWSDFAFIAADGHADAMRRGVKGLRITVAEGFGTGLACYEDFAAKDLTGYTHIHFFIMSTKIMAAGDFQILLDDTAACASPLETLDIPALAPYTWYRVSIALATPAALGAVISVGFNIAVDNGSAVVYIDDIRAVKEFTGDEDDQWDTTVITDLLVCTNNVDAIQKFDGTTVAELGVAILAKSVANFWNHLVFFNTTEGGTAYPHRYRWSDIGDPDELAAGTANYADMLDTQDPGVAVKLLGNRLFAYKEESIWEILFIGGTQVFTHNLVVGNVGTRAIKTIKGIDKEHYFVGNSNFYRFDGSAVSSISPTIRDSLFRPDIAMLQIGSLNRACAVVHLETASYWVALPIGGSSPDQVYVIDLLTGSWVKKLLNASILGLYESVEVVPTWATAVGIWSEQTGSWFGHGIPPSAASILIGDSDGVITQDTRTSSDTSEAVFQTKDFVFGKASRVPYCLIRAKGGEFYVSHSVDQGLTFSGETTFGVSSSFKEFIYEVNETVQTIRFKIRTTAIELEVVWIEPWYIPRARDKEFTRS